MSSVERSDGMIDKFPMTECQLDVYSKCVNISADDDRYIWFCRECLPADVDIERLRDAVIDVVNAHRVLMTHIEVIDDVPHIVYDGRKPKVALNDRDVVDKMGKPFDLYAGPLYRIAIIQSDENVYLYMSLHCLICDAWSFDILIKEICGAYSGIPPKVEDVIFHSATEAWKTHDADAKASGRFFDSILYGIEIQQSLEADGDPYTEDTEGHAVKETDISLSSVFEKAASCGVSDTSFITAAFSYTLSRFTGQDVSLFSFGFEERYGDENEAVGFFVRTVPILSYDNCEKIDELLSITDRSFNECLSHPAYGFRRAEAECGILPNPTLGYIKEKPPIKIDGRIVTTEVITNRCLSGYLSGFLVCVIESDGKYIITADYDRRTYSDAAAESFISCMSRVMEGMLTKDYLSELVLVSENDLEVMDRSNSNDLEFDHGLSTIDRFRQRASEYPDDPAVSYLDHRLSYGELDRITDNIAAELIKRGAGKGTVVSILVPRSEWYVICAVSVLKTGAAYMPIDAEFPEERISFMISDSASQLIITSYDIEYKTELEEILYIEDIVALPNIKAERVETSPDDPFTILYTSGSTGAPKGTVITNLNALNHFIWYVNKFSMTREDVYGSYTSFGFDMFTTGIYPALICGASIDIVPSEVRLDMGALNDHFIANGVTHTFLSTSVAKAFLNDINDSTLKVLIAAGEKLGNVKSPKFCSLYDCYGPTENIALTTYVDVSEKYATDSVGFPNSNNKLYVIDSSGRRLPIGAIGELCISGLQVAKEYLNRPEQSEKAFGTNPFATEDEVKKGYGRMYHSGDFVRYLPDGSIGFVGRRDGQVKIRGNRVEVTEVEECVRACPCISGAAVIAAKSPSGGKSLVAYVVPKDDVDISLLFNIVRDHVSGLKPPYMVPSYVIPMRSIPLNVNGKVDKKRLPKPIMDTPKGEKPRYSTEADLVELFSEVLGATNVHIDTDFFTSGGDSLMAIKLTLFASKKGYKIAYGDIFINQTPRKLAQFIDFGMKDQTVHIEGIREPSDYDYFKIDEVLSKNNIDSLKNGTMRSLGNILLLGSTGFLGIHILSRYLDDFDGDVYCMLKSKRGHTAEGRLYETYDHFFGELPEEYRSRVHVVEGDITSADSFECLHGYDIDTVVNCAANVKHYSDDTDIEAVNYYGVLNIIDYCKEEGSRLIHISTISTSGKIIGKDRDEEALHENELFIGQDFVTKYALSKFAAERAILEEVANGLDAKVMRMGNLFPRYSDGVFQINYDKNAFMGSLRLVSIMGEYPPAFDNVPLEISPIDMAAEAVLRLSETPHECCSFQPYNDRSVLIKDLIDHMRNAGIPMKPVMTSVFISHVEEQNVKDGPGSVSGLVANLNASHGKKGFEVPLENSYTTEALHHLGFDWPEISDRYVADFITELRRFGYFKPI